MKLSIVIPTHNRRLRVLAAIESVLQQTHFAQFGWEYGKQFELIVVDDGSTDATLEAIISRHPNINVVTQSNQGVSVARNSGIAVANGEWLAFLDSDDVWLPSKLSTQFKALERANAMICHTEEVWLRDGVRVNPKQKYVKKAGNIYLECVKHCAMAPSSVLLHRDVLDQVGSFDPNLTVCEDYDLWLRVSAHYEVVLVDEPQVVRAGGHSDQLSTRYWGMDRFRVVGLEKILKLAHTVPDREWLLTSTDLSATLASLIKRLTILKAGAIKHQNKPLQAWVQSKLSHWQHYSFD